MMSLKARRELLAAVSPRYRQSLAREKGPILDEFVRNTGYDRKYAIRMLNHPPREGRRAKRRRARKYTLAVKQALLTLWHAAHGICSKRLVPYLPELIAVLERHEGLCLDAATKVLLIGISPATVDRLLRRERQGMKGHGLPTTKPGTLLKRQIPIRTFSDWDEAQAGFMEADLVAHCGTSTDGEYLHTLVLTDIHTTWTECLALLNRSQFTVSTAIAQVRAVLPFPLLGLDSDNGSEFINATLLRYCQHEQITFTRSRAYEKNDQAHVEQKNWTHVRQFVGYGRYVGEEPYLVLNALCETLRLYMNFFQPTLKLVAKEHIGTHLRKRYDTSRTPYQRVLESPEVPEQTKDQLRVLYASLNPCALLRHMERLQKRLWTLETVRSVNEATIPLKCDS
jgi:hypothetical protein